ncbi:hypothetical protein U14_00118 [Candidatus Moduliflexus flocculans]|uniref:Flavodoxin-like domain-containing protein n=1 Tax=Candidatus Moduliflexus flocculans TaxID=1499966 RepID=A0A0S6VPG4_9BACT|nr:hypothetical protein U14_00118 [Candidatus Moduliflexus flocculans]
MNEQILIAYYSHSANTQKIANLIQAEIGGTLYQIHPQQAYPRAYNAVLEQAKKEIQAGFRPVLASQIDNMAAYEIIFIGTPNWWSSIAPPVATFLSTYDFAGKTIAPFCTHGGGGLGRIEKNIAKLCPRSTVLSCLEISGSGAGNAQAKISAWLRTIGITS